MDVAKWVRHTTFAAKARGPLDISVQSLRAWVSSCGRFQIQTEREFVGGKRKWETWYRVFDGEKDLGSASSLRDAKKLAR